MRLVSVNVGRPRTVPYQGRDVATAIFKQPVTGPVHVGATNLADDRQADRRVHGGPDKAVYAYPLEHYAYWSAALQRRDLAFGFFGENLTLDGANEDEVWIGDTLRVGTALLQVSQPRTPCFKLALRTGVEDFPQRFAASGRTGFYLRVLDEGEVRAGDAVERLARDAASLAVRAVFELRHGPARGRDRAALQRAAALAALAPGWRRAFDEALSRGAS
jgi:MOSC domain-containing protein YiiM